MERLQRFAEQTTPVFTDLKVAAPGIDKAFTKLPAFSNSSAEFFKNLGATSKISGPAIVGSEPLLKRLEAFGAAGKPFTSNLAGLLTSFRDTGGIERLLDFIFLGTGAANGYDALGHFLRTEGVGTICLKYSIKPAPGCSRKLAATGEPTATKASIAGAGLVMARTLAVINGATPSQAMAEFPGRTPSPRELAEGAPSAGAPSAGPTTGGSSARPVGGSTAGTTYYAPSSGGSEAGGLLLNYLLGN
jgi:hypothetical protein